MKRSKLLALLFVLILPLGLACRTHEQAEVDDPDDTAATATEKEIPATDREGDLNPVEAQTMIDDVTIGKQVGSDGMIATENQGDDFAPGEVVHLAMKVADAPAGSVVKVAWYGPGEQKVGDQQKTVDQGAQYLDFASVDTSAWQKGDYRAEVWIGDEKVNTQQFQIVDADDAGK
jgi:hypothetical protein